MCGLMGFVAKQELTSSRIEQVRQAMTCQRHRGPDDTDVVTDARACFGFNRLSIIDIEHSQQPLRWGPADDPERYLLVFNGEIYNYLELRDQLTTQFGVEFQTEGDGEPIVAGFHHVGPEWVQQLRGMFAFLIWDSREQTLFGARDPFGIKPMYYARTPDGYGFSSEAKSLRELTGPAVIEPATLQHYLVLQYVPEPASMDDHLHRLESGCYFTLTSDQEGQQFTQTRYFEPQFDSRPVKGEAEQQELYAGIRSALEDSVAKHMRADVTVGAFLSGGIDSTAIAALAKQHNPDLLTFTTGFKTDGYSEVDVAAESAEAIGVKHFVRWVDEHELFETLPLIVWYLDDPVADPALVPLYFVANEARKHVKVVLSGEGADELFGGYNIYREPMSLRPLTALPDPLRRGLGAVSRALPRGFRGKDMLRRGAINLEDRYYGNARIFREEQLAGLLNSYDPAVSFRDVTDEIYAKSADWDPIARMQHVDLFTWLRGDILVKADRMTMANSLELRVPFLDREVFEVARHIPASEKISREQSKIAMRRALDQIVPKHVLERRKLGFPVPIRVYLKDDYGYSWARQVIADASTDQWIEPQAVIDLLDEHRRGDADNSRRIWAVLVFMLWHDIFVAETRSVEVPRPDYPVEL